MKPGCGSMLLLALILFLGRLVSHVESSVESHGDTVVSICKDAKVGDWRKKMFQLCWLLETPITADEVYCPGVNGNQYAISISRGFQSTREVIKESPGMNEDDYFKQVISKLTEDRIISVSESIMEVLKGVDQAIVGFVDDIDSKEQEVFRQAALAATLPKDMKVYQLTNKNFLPSHAQAQVKGVLHVWVVTNGEWCHLSLPVGQSFTKLFHSLIEPFNRLQYPSKSVFNSEDSYEVYNTHDFHLFIVYHRAKQLDTVHQIVIDPLVNVFRPYFAFVTFNIEKYQPPIVIMPGGPFPCIEILKHGEVNGLHFDSLHRPHSFETFSKILEEIISPKEDTPTYPSTIITHINIGTLQDISSKIDTPAAAGLCEKGSVDCIMMKKKMQKIVIALQKSKKEIEMTLYIVECESVEDISIAKVPKLPYIIAKETSTEWTLYSDTVKIADFITVVQTYGRDLNEPKNASVIKEESSLNSGKHNDSVFDEDEFVALSFPEYFSIPSILPILTNNNFTEYIEQNENCLVAFYVPSGMSPSVVNCAEYPDICEAFDVYRYPIAKYRIGLNSEWVTYKGMFSDQELVKLVDSLRKETMDANTKDKAIECDHTLLLQELTPSVLLSLLKSDESLTTLLVLVTAKKVASPLREILLSLADHQVYWLNSTRYSKLSKFYVGSLLTEPPVLVWADYVKRVLYRLDMKKSVTQQQLKSFINDIHNGKAPDEEIPHHDWSPLSPAIVFPSHLHDEDKYHTYHGNELRHYQYIEHNNINDEPHTPVNTYRREQGSMSEEGVTLDEEEEEQHGSYPSHRQEL